MDQSPLKHREPRPRGGRRFSGQGPTIRRVAYRAAGVAREQARGRSACRAGLAPVEFVLWLPVLLFVTALLVNYGTAAAWRIRSEVAARETVDRQVTPRTARNEPRPQNLPQGDASVFGEPVGRGIDELDLPQLREPAIVGPVLDSWRVYPTLTHQSIRTLQGESEIQRLFPLLPGLGSYRSGPVRQLTLSDSGSIARTYFRGLLPIPREALLDSASWELSLHTELGQHYRPTVSNETRRSKLLYRFPDLWNQAAWRFVAAMQALRVEVGRPGWEIMDRDRDFLRFRGAAPDFYPRARRPCEASPQRLRELALERYVIDWFDIRRGVQLGGITRLPATLTARFLELYQSELDAAREGESAASQAELERKLGQLKQYQGRWPDIRERLRASSSANAPD